MGEDGHELVLDLVGLLGLASRGLLAEELELPLVGLAALGEVARHLGEAPQRARVVPDGGDRHVGPEEGPVLPDPPRLFPVVPDRGGHRQLVLRVSRPHVVGTIEGREVPPDDLIGPVALDPLGPAIPARDVALGLQHEDRVVLDRLHEEAESLLALAQGFLAPATLGEVARDLEEAVDLAVRIPEDVDDHAGPERRAVLAETPALLPVAPVAARDLKSLSGAPRLHVLGAVEDREVLADDLFGPIALDALRAGVPADHVAVRVEEEDGVVLDARDQPPEGLLGFGELQGSRLLAIHDSRFSIGRGGPAGRAGERK